MSYLMDVQKMSLLNITADTTASIPAGYSILQVIVQNTTGNAITGGLRIGTTAGGVDVVLAFTVSANSLLVIPDSQLLKAVFSTSAATTLYVQAVTLWNSANINIHFVLRKFT